MSFNIGAGIAKAAGGVADIAENQIKNNQQLDMQKELQDVETAKQLALDDAKFKRDEQRKDDHQAKVNSITGSVETADDKAGGYEPEGAKEKRQYGLLQNKVDALVKAGEYDDAKVLQGQLDKLDSKNSKEAQLELKTLIANQNFENKTGLLNAQLERNKMQNEVSLAKLEAQQARGSAGIKQTPEEADYAAYVKRITDDGKKPMSLDVYNSYNKERDAKLKQKNDIEHKIEFGYDGKKMSETVTTHGDAKYNQPIIHSYKDFFKK